MPPLPPVADTLKAVIHWTVGPDLTAENVTHWGYSGTAPNAAACLALAGTFRTACTAIDAMASTNNAMTSFTVQDLASTLGASGTNTTNIACSRSGTALTNNACANVGFLVPNRYRGGKGKAFFPFGVTTDLLNTQSWGSSFISAVNTAVAGWAAAFIGASSGGCTVTEQRVVSYYAGYNTAVIDPVTGRAKQTPKLRATPIWYSVDGYSCRPQVGSQRRRLKR